MRCGFAIGQVQHTDTSSFGLQLQDPTGGAQFRIIRVRGDNQAVNHFVFSLFCAIRSGRRCPNLRLSAPFLSTMVSDYQQYVICDLPMKLGKSNCFVAILMAAGLLPAGCAELAWNRDQEPAGVQAPSLSDRQWGRAPTSSSAEKKDSFFFNTKSREIEKSLGL